MLKTIALSTGDPAGIGPELAAMLIREGGFPDDLRILLLGDAAVFRQHGIDECHHDDQVSFLNRAGLHAVDCGFLVEAPPLGTASALSGEASLVYIDTAIQLVHAGEAQAVVTGPINKYALNLAGIPFPGHTEIFADRTGSEVVAMLMYSSQLAVALCTLHVSLSEAIGQLSTDRIVTTGQLLAKHLRQLRGQTPRIALLGLNPHAGEQGLFGREEIDVIAPARERLLAEGIAISDILPPDTAFTAASRALYDGWLCHYHDQGLIPFKALCFEEGVNITMGIPFPRVSVDHGTAYDIVGKGVASPASLREAIMIAYQLMSESGG